MEGLLRWLVMSVIHLALASLHSPSRYGGYQDDVRDLKNVNY